MEIEVCLTPALIEQHDLRDKIVVVIDIFRATSCMVAGLSNGVKSIIPVSTIKECLEMGRDNKVMAGERNGVKVEAFDIGNSPFDYLKDEMKGTNIVATTTNGTLAIHKSMAAEQIVLGAFLNLTSTAKYLRESKKNLVLHCAAWKLQPNLEDTLFAGALIDRLAGSCILGNDAAHLSLSLYLKHQEDITDAGLKSSHAKRLRGFGINKDLYFCLREDLYDTVVVLDGDKLISK